MARKAVDDLLFASFVAIEGAQIYSAYLPSYFTIKRFGRDSSAAHDLRVGEAISTIYLMLLAIVVSFMIESWLPVVFAIATALLVIPVYEYGIRTASSDVGYLKG